jgi:biopolymer transport protein ExbD
VKKRIKKNDEVEVQFTSMIDMVFLLLIFFMVSAKFVLPERAIPAFGMEKTEGIGGGFNPGVVPYRIHLLKDNDGTVLVKGGYRGPGAEITVRINDIDPRNLQDPFVEDLKQYLKDNLTESGAPEEGVEVTLQCDDNVRWEAMVRMMDVIREAKIPKIRFAEES